jgi:hypothetical protein
VEAEDRARFHPRAGAGPGLGPPFQAIEKEGRRNGKYLLFLYICSLRRLRSNRNSFQVSGLASRSLTATLASNI